MSCNQYNDNIMRYFDGNLNDIENAQLKQHLKSCKECSVDFEGLKEIFGVLEADQMIEPPQNFEIEVMEKVKALDVVRKKRTNTFLIGLYGMTTAILVALSILFILSFREISLFKAVDQLGTYFTSVSSTMLTIGNILEAFHSLVTLLISAVIQVSFMIAKTYYYVFLVLLAMFFVVQKMFINLVKHTDGGTR